MAAELIATLSAPQSSTAAASSRERMPPPTVNGMKSCRAVRRTVSSRVLRDSAVAVMSRNTISSAPASLCAAANSAGSPASRNCTNCIPLTTRPPWTSRQAMMRLASVSQCTEILQNLHSYLAGFLGMKLQSEEIVALHRSGERFFVGASSDRLGAQRRAIRMREIDIRSVGDARQQPRLSCNLDAVPSHMRRLHAIGESRAGPVERTQAAQFGGLIASVKHPLQSETDSQHRLVACDCVANRVAKTALGKRRRRFEIADAGNDQLASACDPLGVGRDYTLLPEMLDGLCHRGEVAGAVINDSNHVVILSEPALKLALASRKTCIPGACSRLESSSHKMPFVLGSMRPSWRSLEQATRSARAKALNNASIL